MYITNVTVTKQWKLHSYFFHHSESWNYSYITFSEENTAITNFLTCSKWIWEAHVYKLLFPRYLGFFLNYLLEDNEWVEVMMKWSYLLFAQHPEDNWSRSRRFHTPPLDFLWIWNIRNVTMVNFGETLKGTGTYFEQGGATKDQSMLILQSSNTSDLDYCLPFFKNNINISVLNLNMQSL